MYINRRFYQNYVSTRDVELLHEYSLRVLKEVGVSFASEEALKIFKEHGATVEGNIVKISEELLNKALATAPRQFTVTTSSGETHIGERFKPKTVGCYGPPKFLFEDDTYRPAMLPDNVKFLKLMHTSDVTDFVNNAAYDTQDLDKTKDNFYLPQVAMCLKYSDKPTYGNIANSLNVRNQNLKEATKEIVNIYREFYDIWDRPVLLTNACGLSPLGYSYEVLDNIMGLVEEGQPVTLITCSMTNLTAPAALLGSVIQNNATILAGIVLTQLIKPGVGVIYGTVSSPTDMRVTALEIGAPESQLIQMSSLALGRYYGLPVRTGVAGSDSLKPDFQAGVESMTTLMTTYLGKSDFVLNHAGILQSYAVGSYEKFVLDEEVNRILMRLNKGIDISDMKASKVFEEIKKAGPMGNYLTGRTPKEYRNEHHLSKIFNKTAGDPTPLFEEIGDIRQRASKQIEERVENYKAPDLTKKQQEILNRYLPETEKF
jgi:trimethylamine--corrinoid protein Co-methyltransferase